MKFELKNHKLEKTKNYLRRTPIIIVYQAPSLNLEHWLEIEQRLSCYGLKYFRLYNTLVVNVLTKSIFQNMNVLINSSICLARFCDSTKTPQLFQKLINLNSSILFLGLRLNNKVYSKSELRTLSTINYCTNVKIFNKSLKKLLKLPYLKINN